MSSLPKGHVELGSALASNNHFPGRSYHHVNVVVSRRGAAYRCRVLETWGSDQGHLEQHGRAEVVARGWCVGEAAAQAKALARDAGIDAAKLAEALSKAVDEAREAEADKDEKRQQQSQHRETEPAQAAGAGSQG